MEQKRVNVTFEELVHIIYTALTRNKISFGEKHDFIIRVLNNSEIDVLGNECYEVIFNTDTPTVEANNILMQRKIENRYWYIRYSSFLDLFMLESFPTLEDIIARIASKNQGIQIEDGYVTAEFMIDAVNGDIRNSKQEIQNLVSRFDKLKRHRLHVIEKEPSYAVYNEIEVEILSAVLE